MLNMQERTERAARRPYFIWDYDLTEDDVRAILRGENEYMKIQMMVRILESARWSDIWRYLTIGEVRRYWPQLYRQMRREVRDVWAWAAAMKCDDCPSPRQAFHCIRDSGAQGVNRGPGDPDERNTYAS